MMAEPAQRALDDAIHITEGGIVTLCEQDCLTGMNVVELDDVLYDGGIDYGAGCWTCIQKMERWRAA